MTLKTVLCFILSLCCLSVGPAFAAQECGNGTAADMLDCSKRQFESADQEMSRLYQTLLTRKRSDSAKENFETAQKEWLGFRSDYCKEKTSAYEGGSMAPVVENLCKAHVTKSRLKTFKSLSLKGLQGSTR